MNRIVAIKRLRAHWVSTTIYVIIALLVIGGALFLWQRLNDHEVPLPSPEPRQYTYEETVASNGMVLHTLKTLPSNITLQAVKGNVSVAPFYGINGGFFYQQALVSIAVVNDLPVNGAPGEYGSGEENMKYARGTLVWDGATGSLSVQVVRRQTELAVTDRANYWAQGGISMGLDLGDAWLAEMTAENAPYWDEPRLRSAIVYDRSGNVYLIVSEGLGTLTEFREAILEKVGGGELANGIFLDGDGSSQMRSREKSLKGDGRPVVQMLRLVS
ncbi:phosphodiester glycosidase family protein [Cohnella sp. AR92]|uniref:phosphodiester glycosidase family protein n=1 Tax=Cohnella sp. AR92 TaxID=648716 RepID=UPI001EE0AAC2|nr:phosphodiester glycosidase family protein [Cohnella sp. AR92]